MKSCSPQTIATALLISSEGATTSILRFAAATAAKRKYGRGRNKNGGMKSLKVLCTHRRFVAAHAATRNGNGEQKRGAFIWRVSLERTRRELRKERGTHHDDPS